jgi:large subunit ribosomal protein L9
MAHTNVLLREDIDDLGARGEIVKVKAGYARNYLLPRKLAVEATASNVRQIEQERARLLKKEATERATAEAQAGQLGALRLNFERRVGEHGLLYGSVTSMDIAEALKEKGYEIDRRRITLRDPIKETGEHTVPVRLHRDVTVEIPVVVSGAGGAQTANAPTANAPTDEATAAPAAEANAPTEGGAETEGASTEEGAAGEASA